MHAIVCPTTGSVKVPEANACDSYLCLLLSYGASFRTSTLPISRLGFDRGVCVSGC
jgi:hypothetical protein